VGRIDIGASLSWISQYPGEAEIVFPPLSFLEVVGHPRVETTSKGELIIFPLRINMNIKALTIEKMIEQRKSLYFSVAKKLKEELTFDLSKVLEDLQVKLFAS
jgi:hypothetical protein